MSHRSGELTPPRSGLLFHAEELDDQKIRDARYHEIWHSVYKYACTREMVWFPVASETATYVMDVRDKMWAKKMDSMTWEDDLKLALAALHLKLFDATRLEEIVSGSESDSLNSVTLSDECLAFISEAFV